MWVPPAEHPVRRVFAGLTEHTFLTTLGVADPSLIDYLSALLARFIHMDDIYRLRQDGRPVTEVVDMVMQASGLPQEGRTAREVHRHARGHSQSYLWPQPNPQPQRVHPHLFVHPGS